MLQLIYPALDQKNQLQGVKRSKHPFIPNALVGKGFFRSQVSLDSSCDFKGCCRHRRPRHGQHSSQRTPCRYMTLEESHFLDYYPDNWELYYVRSFASFQRASSFVHLFAILPADSIQEPLVLPPVTRLQELPVNVFPQERKKLYGKNPSRAPQGSYQQDASPSNQLWSRLGACRACAIRMDLEYFLQGKLVQLRADFPSCKEEHCHLDIYMESLLDRTYATTVTEKAARHRQDSDQQVA